MAIDFNKLWKKVRADVTADEAESVRTLAKILSSKEGRTFVLNLGQSDAVFCIEILDHGLAEGGLCAAEKQAFFGTLRRLAGKHARLPKSMVIRDEIDFSATSQLCTSGGFADIKPGKYKGCTVVMKKLRVAETDNFDKIRKQFCKEVILWNSLSHPNVLKLVGVLGGIDQRQFATVSEWMAHGNIMEYIRKKATNRLELLHGTAQGLKYLHEANLTHGDLKGANILITNDTPPKACLADFGFTTMVFDPRNAMSSSFALKGGTITFMAPELLAPSKYGLESAVPTQETDIYAFGLVVLQVLTGKQPFDGMRSWEPRLRIPSGFRPEKPGNAEAIGISESLWTLIQKCWDGNRTQRPHIQDVVEGVGDVAANWHVLTPPSVAEYLEDTVEEESDELKHIGIFESYRSEDLPAVRASINTSTNTSESSNAHTVSTQLTDPESYEAHAKPEFKHLNQNNPTPPTALPPQKRKGFKYLLNKVPIFRRKQKR